MRRNLGDIEKALLLQAKEYLQELDTTVDDLDADVLKLTEPGETDDSLLRISRNAHSIKGSAGSFGFDLISTICHSLEDRVSGIRADGESLGLQIDGLLRYLDLIRSAARAYAREDKAGLDSVKLALGVNPRPPNEAVGTPTPTTISVKRHRVLLVEKMGPVMRMASNVLNQVDPSNMEIAVAGNGYEAFGRLLREPFDCVVMSNTTDLVTGTELIKLLADCRHPNTSTPFVLLTSDHRLKAPEGERQTHVIMKGADLKQQLSDTCERILGTGSPLSNFSRGDTVKQVISSNMLVIEKSASLQDLS